MERVISFDCKTSQEPGMVNKNSISEMHYDAAANVVFGTSRREQQSDDI